MTKPNTLLTFSNGSQMKNRFMLAPLTNTQSHETGQLSDEEFKWLTLRAKGNFGMVMTCASHVQEIGKGFPGQLGIFSDSLMNGHRKLAQSIQSYDSLAVIQLHHAGMRSPNELIGTTSICPSDNAEHHARAMTITEISELKKDFVSAAIRAKKCGYDGVEIHAAHGYIIAQFLSPTINQRTDQYGGSLENRARLLLEITEEIRKSCGTDFLLGVRLSPEKYGMDIAETKWFAGALINQGDIDFLDISLWDSFKYPKDEKYQNKTLLEHFSNIDYKHVKWTIAGKIRNGKDVQKVLNAGVDFVGVGRSGILHHNFPDLVINNPDFEHMETPVTREYLISEGLGNKFIEYLGKWPDLVSL